MFPCNDKSDTHYISELTREALRIAMVGSSVSAALIFLEIIMHLAHTRTNRDIISATILASAAKAAMAAYPSSAAVASIKNGTLSQRSRLEDFFESTESIEPSQNANSKYASKVSLLTAGMIVTSLGLADTTLTQFYCNKRTWAFQKAFDPTFKIPNPKTYQDYHKAFRIGYSIRASRNVTNVAGYFLTPQVESLLGNKLPETKYINLTALTSVMACGSTVGTISNMFDILYKQQAIQVCPNHLTTPSVASIMKKMMMNEGPKAFRRGLAGSMLYTTAAYAVVPKAEKLADTALGFRFFTKSITKKLLADTVARQEEERTNPFSPF